MRCVCYVSAVIFATKEAQVEGRVLFKAAREQSDLHGLLGSPGSLTPVSAIENSENETPSVWPFVELVEADPSKDEFYANDNIRLRRLIEDIATKEDKLIEEKERVEAERVEAEHTENRKPLPLFSDFVIPAGYTPRYRKSESPLAPEFDLEPDLLTQDQETIGSEESDEVDYISVNGRRLPLQVPNIEMISYKE